MDKNMALNVKLALIKHKRAIHFTMEKENYVVQKVLKAVVPYTWLNLQSLAGELQGYMTKLVNYKNSKPYSYHALDLLALNHGISFDKLNELIAKYERAYIYST